MTDAEKSACCDGRQPFTNMRKAKAVAKRMRRETGEPIAPYRCKACRKIHLGGTV